MKTQTPNSDHTKVIVIAVIIGVVTILVGTIIIVSQVVPHSELLSQKYTCDLIVSRQGAPPSHNYFPSDTDLTGMNETINSEITIHIVCSG